MHPPLPRPAPIAYTPAKAGKRGGHMSGKGLQTLSYFVLLALILYTAGSGVQ